MILGDTGKDFHDFGEPGDGLEFVGFPICPGAAPDPVTLLVEARWFHPWDLVITIPGSLSPIQEILRPTELGSLETELRVHRNTLKTGLQRIYRSPAAPHEEGPVDSDFQGFSMPQLCFKNL